MSNLIVAAVFLWSTYGARGLKVAGLSLASQHKGFLGGFFVNTLYEHHLTFTNPYRRR